MIKEILFTFSMISSQFNGRIFSIFYDVTPYHWIDKMFSH